MNQRERTGSDARRRGPSGGTEATESMVSILDGDRACLGCGYNLSGQPILREPHYDLLVVRCPECGKVAGIEEYPLLGRAAGRLAAAGLAIWILLCVGFTAATAGALFGMTLALSEEILWPLTEELQRDFQSWSAEHVSAQNVYALPRPEQRAAVDTWLEACGGIDGFVNARGGWLAAIDPWASLFWVPMGAISFAVGAAWSVLLLGCSRRRLIAVALALVAVAAVFVASEILHSTSGRGTLWWSQMINQELASLASAPTRAVALALLALPFVLGTWLGRSMARGIVRVLLPPKLRTPLGFLWIADQLPPPTTRGASSRGAAGRARAGDPAPVTARTPPP